MRGEPPRFAAALIGNLDCEVTWTGGPPLPPAVVARLARLATTLRALAPAGVADDDVALWLPAPVPAADVPAAGGPLPHLVTGPLPAADRILPWGALPLAPPPAPGPPFPVRPERRASASEPEDEGPCLTWRDLLWRLPPASVAVARAASDRRLAHALAAELGVALSGSRTIISVAELRAHLAAGGADASPAGAWVVKAPVTAAGRERVKRVGSTVDDAVATRVARLLDRHGALVFEPWLDRTADVAIGGLVLDDARVHLLPPHRPWCDSAGVVRGIVVDDGAGLEPSHRRELERVGAAAGARLAALGYHGAFVVDALVHRTAAGPRLHPLVELNPRLTFGLVARAWAERTGARVLGLGGPPHPSARPLVLAADGSPAAWLADADADADADAPPTDVSG